MQVKNKELHRITSTALIYKDKKYLIARRASYKKVFPGKWCVPGGGLEVDDYINIPKTTKDLWYFAIEKSLRREIKEEVNLEVGKLKYLLDIVHITPNFPAIILSFYCSYKSGRVKLNKENDKYVWVTYEQAKKYDFVDGMLEEIEMVDRILKGENEDDIKYRC
ncbi:MAG: NUDIX domain-containing protein [bacterium]